MKQKHLIEIAGALLLARWKQTLIAAIGVTFSIALFVTLLGFMEGLNNLLDGMVLNRTPHIRLYNDTQPSQNQPIDLSDEYKDHHNFISSIKPTNTRKEIYNAQKIIQKLNNDNRVVGVSAKLSAQVFYNYGNTDINGIINGLEVNKESKLFAFEEYLAKGNYQDLENIPNSIILGQGVAELINAQIDDLINITTSEGQQFSLKVVGFYQTGMAQIDKVQSYASLKTTRRIKGVSNNYVGDIQIKLKNLDKAPLTAIEYEKFFNLNAEDLQTANAQFETGSSVRSIISYAVGIALLIVSGFGIYNILNMLIYEKMDTIAILKATGYNSSDVKKIFISISLSIGLSGALFGVLLGYLLSNIVDTIPFDAPSVPNVTTYPIDYGVQYYSIAIIFAIIMTFLAGWLPAQKASKVDPVVIIRGK
ncbi:MAG TPA: FtsX-like permease family protein [Salinivirga sp.]|uniref:ABC transporter permease n=1 Tax=Salinivirga sp. TaxID=1970192 RepID=UPI002B46E284|nr:FtsX-like permease family protein [Salinivirga sp.]HKK58949.1 FtsX-like permease family protein [Salinivirga sp.]